MSQRTNPIWDFFCKVDGNASKAKCCECDKLLSLGSDKPSKQTIHGLKYHLEKCHKELYVSYSEKVESRRSQAQEPPAKRAKLEETSSAKQSVQLTLQSCNERSTKWPDDHPSVHRINKGIMDCIIVDMLPYSIVAGEAFKRLNFADPSGVRRYELKSEKYFRTSLMPATYEKVACKVRQLLVDVEWISFTTDGWTNPSKSCSLLSFTAHFLQQSTRKKVVLGAMVLEEDHTGAYLASKLAEAMQTWNVATKVHMGIRDNAANMVSAMRIAQVDDFGCMAHTLQLVLNDALFCQTTVEKIVKKSRKIVTHFKHSEQACRHLSTCQQSCDVPEHQLIQDVETRWNSTYLMLQRISEQRKALSLYSVEHGSIAMLTKTELEMIDDIVSVLKPFYDATVEISHDDACISLVIPIVSLLSAKLQSTTERTGLSQMKAALRDAMSRRFRNVKVEENVIAATLLDPRFKDMYFSAQETEQAKRVILSFLHSIQSQETATSATTESSRDDNRQPSTSTSSGLWDDYDNFVPDSTPTAATSTLPTVDVELDNYLREPRVGRATNIYGFWNCSQFPGLEAAARKFLSSPPTSVASEQLFSAAGQIYSDRRSSLLGENAEKLLFLAYNIRLFDYQY